MGAIAAAVIAAGATAYGANKTSSDAKKGRNAQRGATKDALDQLSGFDLGGVPQAAKYSPINMSQEQVENVLANLKALPNIQQLMRKTNAGISEDAKTRAISMIPGYMESMRTAGANTSSLLRGELPFEDVAGIVSDRAAMGGSIGIPGTSGAATMKDLGISRWDAMKTGTGMLGNMVSMAETIAPRSSYMNPREMFTSPEERMRIALEQAGLDQQSDQNFYNLAATGDPNDLARAQLLVGSALTQPRGGGISADYSGAAKALGEGISSAYGSRTKSTSPASTSTKAANPYAAGTWQHSAYGV